MTNLELNNHLNLGKTGNTSAYPFKGSGQITQTPPGPRALVDMRGPGAIAEPIKAMISVSTLRHPSYFLCLLHLLLFPWVDTQTLLMANQLSPGFYKWDVKVWGNPVSAQKWARWDTIKCLLGWVTYHDPTEMLWYFFFQLVPWLCLALLWFVKCATHWRYTASVWDAQPSLCHENQTLHRQSS